MEADSSGGPADTSHARSPPAKVYAVSLCDGIGGIFLALDLLGAPFDGVAAEKEWHLRELTRRRFPWLQTWSDCMSLRPEAMVQAATQSA